MVLADRQRTGARDVRDRQSAFLFPGVELCLGGAGLARGYRNLPELTAAKFPTRPGLGRVFRTGDLAHRSPDGRFFYHGRIDSLVKLLLEALAETWRPIVNLAFGIRGRETRPQMLQVAAPNEIVIMVVLDARIGDTRGMINLCFPASIVESAGGHFVQAWHQQRREPTPAERSWLRENLARVRMPLTASLDARLTTREIADRLFISTKTTDHHIQHIYNKIGVSTRAAAALWAIQNAVVA